MPLEDYTTYIENDPNGRFAVTANTITVTGLRRDDTTTWVYKDFGVDFFEALPLGIDFDCQADSMANASTIPAFVLSNTIEHWIDLFDHGDAYTLQMTSTGAGVKLLFFDAVGGTARDYDSFANTLGARRYCTFTRSGATGTVKIYSDSGRTTLLDTLIVTTGYAAGLRYFMPTSNYGSGAGAASGDVSNHELLDGTLGGGPQGSYFVELEGMVW